MSSKAGAGRITVVAAAVLALLAGCASSTSPAAEPTPVAASAAPTSIEPSTTEPAPATAAASTTEPERSGGDMTVGLDGEPPTLDPAGNADTVANGAVFAAIYESLFLTDADGSVHPQLAESATPNADDTVWRLALRHDVRFHDGTAFDADAVVFNLERQRQSPYNSTSLLPVQAVTKIDDFTVDLVLSSPWVAVPSVLSGLVGLMASPTAAADPDFGRSPVGTGPYRFRDWDTDRQIVVERFDDYWGPEPAPLDTLTFRFFPLEAPRVAAFEAGELDAFLTGTEATAEEQTAAGAQVVGSPQNAFGILLLNLDRPPLDDVRVRQALEIGYDRDAVAAAFQGQPYADASFSPFPTDNPWWEPPDTAPAFDPDRAKALLAEYGKPVAFTIDFLAGSQDIEDGARAMIEYWNDLGMQVQLNVLPDVGAYVTAALARDFDAMAWLGEATGDPDTVLYDSFHSGGVWNLTGYSNPTVDTALDLGRRSADPNVRRDAYATVQTELRRDQPELILSHSRLYVVATDEVTGIEPGLDFPSRTIRLAG